jgi:hypothetical protein
MDTVDWRDLKYDETFEQEVRGLERRRANTLCTVADVEALLEHLYKLDGDNWVGRGEVQDIIMAATIAAYEHFIAEWKSALTK